MTFLYKIYSTKVESVTWLQSWLQVYNSGQLATSESKSGVIESSNLCLLSSMSIPPSDEVRSHSSSRRLKIRVHSSSVNIIDEVCISAQFVHLVLHCCALVLVCAHWVTAQQHCKRVNFMAKQTHKRTVTTVATVPAPTNVTAQGTAQPQVIDTVKAGLKYRGARAAWYAVLLQHQGKPAADFLAATTAQPPSLPKSGVQEKSTGWLTYFVRTGVATLK